VKKPNIVLAKPKGQDVDSLKVFLDLAHPESHQQLFNIGSLDRVELHSTYMDVVIVCQDLLASEEEEILRTNRLLPVIMVSERPQEKLIQDLNIYRSTPRINKEIANLIDEALDSRKLIIGSIGERPELVFNLESTIQNELEQAGQEQRVISSFEALRNILQRNPKEIYENAKKDKSEIIMEILHAKVIPYLDLYEKTENPDHLATARANFLPCLHVLKEVDYDYRTGNRDKLIQIYAGGSTISEQGIRCLVNINFNKKYDITKGPHGYFLRDVHNRKGVSHTQIAQTRYDTQKMLSELFDNNGNGSAEVGKFPKMYHLLHYESVSYLIQEALIGPDLEYVLLKLRDAIPKAESRQATLFRKVRTAVIEKYLDDLVGWQKHTQKMIDSEETKRIGGRKPEVVARYFKSNLNKVPAAYQAEDLTEFSEAELSLWDTCLKYLNPAMLGISKKSIVLSQDASSKNAILHIGRKFPSIDELTDALTEPGKHGRREPSREKIDEHFYHVDTGFIATHFLEDFFHIIDAFEAADIDMSKNQILKQRQGWYEYFCDKKGIKQEPVVLNLAGAYRNMRRAFLVIKEFQNKNIKFARDNLITEYTYTAFRRSYEQMNEHHMSRAVIYLDNLNELFEDLAANTSIHIGDVESAYKKVTSAPLIDAEATNRASEFILNLQQRREAEKNHRKRKYLGSVLHGTMSYCMARMAEKMIKVKLPNYEDARRGVSDE